MLTIDAPDRVIVVPRNGYANRLQAWASASIAASEWGSPLAVVWEPERIAPATATELFADKYPGVDFLSPQELTSLLGCHHSELPRYLTIHFERNLIVLAGHDHGEQSYMPALTSALAEFTTRPTVLIIAGGKFDLPTTVAFDQRRQDFYRNLHWSHSVSRRVDAALVDRPSYLSLHIRQTDRSIAAPTAGAIRRSLEHMRREMPQRSLLIAADTSKARDEWSTTSRAMGFEPWSLNDVDLDRASVTGGVDALAEWCLLSRSEALIYPAASTFSGEAAIASGNAMLSMPLSAPSVLRLSRNARRHLSSALTWPRRRIQGHRP